MISNKQLIEQLRAKNKELKNKLDAIENYAKEQLSSNADMQPKEVLKLLGVEND
jgi:oligoendopeptidase F